MTIDFNQLHAFVHVVETGSFTAAAKALRTSKSTISKQIRELEERLGTTLLQRSTRKTHITAHGQRFYRRCQPLLQQLLQAETELQGLAMEPKGKISCTAPTAFGAIVLSKICIAFLERYPKIQLDITLSDENLDLIKRGLDCAVRLGPLEDSAMKCRTLCKIQRGFFATPRLLEHWGTPQTVEEMARLPALEVDIFAGRRWEFTTPEGSQRMSFQHSVLTVNSTLFLRDACLASRGVAMLPDYLTRQAEADGVLVRVLPETSIRAVDASLVYPEPTVPAPLLTIFADFLQARLKRASSGQEPDSTS